MQNIARIYCRIPPESQNLNRELELKEWAKTLNLNTVKVYTEKVNGRTSKRQKLKELLNDLQHGEVIIIGNIDQLSRLPISEAENLVSQIKNKEALLLLPDVLNPPSNTEKYANIIFNNMQNLLFRILLKSAYDAHKFRRERQKESMEIAQKNGSTLGRKIEQKNIDKVYSCREKQKLSISETAKALNYSESSIKRIMRMIKEGVYTPSE